jgi:hypothetical protein
MSYPMEILTNFSVLRRAVDNRRPPSFQMLFAQIHNWGEYHRVENVDWVRVDEVYPVIRQPDSEIDENIYTLRIRRPGWPHTQVFKFWRLPFYFMRNGARIPVLDFQYTSWIPNGYVPIPIPAEGRESIVDFMNEIKQQRCNQITNPGGPVLVPRVEVDNDILQRTPTRDTQSPILGGAPPRRRRRGRMQDEQNDVMAANLLTLLNEERVAARPPNLDIPPPNGEDDFSDLPDLISFTPNVPTHHVQIIKEPLTLPKHVGDLILADARRGNQDCPIAAVSFRECSELTVTSCFHVFDCRSLGVWLEEHNTCPVCRTRIVNVING